MEKNISRMKDMEEDKESLQPQKQDGQEVTDSVMNETAETAEAAGVVDAPDAEQPAGKRGSAIEKAKVTLLAVIAACLVTIVIQNFFPSEREVNGNMWVDGGYVSVDGGYVNVGGEVSVGNLGSATDLQGGLMRASYNVGYDAIPVKLVGVEIHRISSSPSEENCVPIDIRMVDGTSVSKSYVRPIRVTTN